VIQLTVHVIELKSHRILFSTIHTRRIRQQLQHQRLVASIRGDPKSSNL
jgi:hypothetical protein